MPLMRVRYTQIRDGESNYEISYEHKEIGRREHRAPPHKRLLGSEGGTPM